MINGEVALAQGGEEADEEFPDLVPTALGGGKHHRPSFETLFVTAQPASKWQALIDNTRRLRRNEDQFVYEPVIRRLVRGRGLRHHGQSAHCGGRDDRRHALSLAARRADPAHRFLTRCVMRTRERATGVDLAKVMKTIRPELDVYLLSDHDVEALAGDPQRRLPPPHILRSRGTAGTASVDPGRASRRASKRPSSTISRNMRSGRSARSTRCRSRAASRCSGPTGSATWASSTASNLFLAESSATTGGLDSLLEPTGNIKKAQEMAARAFGADHVFFVTNGTSTTQQDGGAGAGEAGRHRHRRPQLPQVAPLRHGAWRRPAALCRSLPADAIFDVRRGAAARRSRRRCST